MKTVNVTEVVRNFSEVLDGVEHRHQTYVVTRGDKPIARITPVPSANGFEVKRLLRDQTPDAAWASDLAALRASLPAARAVAGVRTGVAVRLVPGSAEG
jgi:antitoxin (DNA-binding transcriptional repressor) of toxin-antitoxin stability system